MKIKCILNVICISLAIIFIPGRSFAGQGLLNRFLDDSVRAQRNIIYVTRDEIKLWAPQQKEVVSIIKRKKTLLMESFISPSLFLDREKVLYSVNEYNDKGELLAKLIIYDLKKKSENVIYKSKKSLISPILSPDNKKIAFLSDYKPENTYSLFIIDISTKEILTLSDDNRILGGGYNFSISWSPDSNEIAYSDINGCVNVINIKTKENQKLIKGYEPLFSPDGKKMIFSDSQFKPYKPLIYNFSSKQIQKVATGKVDNAIWSPDGQYLIIVQRYARLKDWVTLNEWRKKVVLYEVATKEKTDLFEYEGFEYIDFK